MDSFYFHINRCLFFSRNKEIVWFYEVKAEICLPCVGNSSVFCCTYGGVQGPQTVGKAGM